jgi:pSer/pThr/pTyr-binding forkhead associated (FHA) protein
VPDDELGYAPTPPQFARERHSASATPQTRSTLQFFDIKLGKWHELGEVSHEGAILGRSTFLLWDPSTEELAEEHPRIGFEGDELYVEPLESLNGVYRRLQPHRREQLLPHSRFRIGRHVLEFRLAELPAKITPLRSIDGEVFQSRIPVPLGFIDVIGPDGRPYFGFPVTKREERGTRIGRAGVECDFALAGDEWVSLRHARIFRADGQWWLDDLESTNGTYLIVKGRTPLRRGTTRNPDSGDELLVGKYKIRVVEKTA